MTELRRQDIQSYADQAISRRRYRDDEIPCSAIKKDPDGGLQCTVRGLATDGPYLFQAYDLTSKQVLTAQWEDLNIATVLFNSDDVGDVFNLSGNELEILRTGDVDIEVKVTVSTPNSGNWEYEIVISEDDATVTGHVQDPTTISNGGRGTA